MAELVAAYEAGSPTTALMNRFGLSKGATLKLLRQAGVMLRKQPLSADAAIEALSMHERGASLVEVADKVGSAPTTVRRALLEAGVSMRPRGRGSRLSTGPDMSDHLSIHA